MRAIARAHQERNLGAFEKALRDYKDGESFFFVFSLFFLGGFWGSGVLSPVPHLSFYLLDFALFHRVVDFHLFHCFANYLRTFSLPVLPFLCPIRAPLAVSVLPFPFAFLPP